MVSEVSQELDVEPASSLQGRVMDDGHERSRLFPPVPFVCVKQKRLFEPSVFALSTGARDSAESEICRGSGVTISELLSHFQDGEEMD